MSPQAGYLLETQVVPRLRAVIPRAVLCIGSETHEDLIADATLLAARNMHNAEAKGKTITASSAAYYSIQHLKSGRRAVGNSSSDVHGSATQLNGRSRIESMDQIVTSDGETGGESYELHDVLANEQEDPATQAARKMDWDTFMAGLSVMDQALIDCLVEGKPLATLARKRHLHNATLSYHKRRIAEAIVNFMGADIIIEIQKRPGWKNNLDATREKMACKYDRCH